MGNHVMNLIESSDTSPVVDKENVVTNITDTLRLCSPMNNQTVSAPSLLEIPWDTSLVTVAAVKALVMYGVAVHFVLGITMVDKSGEGKRTALVLDFVNSSWSLLKNKIFLCNGLSALFILAGLLGINQIQTILSATPEFVDSTDTEDSMRNHSNHSLPRILVKYSAPDEKFSNK
ncbi:uncharacterized protein LOC103512785 [Diaphorina citri]|uniref:Uncharacterized protein LOC103512785 n=1 Tax=Diaphorina citri TaxID=121845 RepID=A0A1S3D6Z7_DIACI|nr:uncharacterized protein LOC103512785 [Diaphorina citri]